MTNAKGEKTAYTYDLNGNMLTQTDGNGHTTIFEYNVSDKLIKRIDHGGRVGAGGNHTYIDAKTESYTYYADGNLKTKTDRNGKVTNHEYDIHGRLVKKSIDTQEICYTYDNNGNQLTMTDETGTTECTYDEENRALTKTVPHIGMSLYQYDILQLEGHHIETTTDPKGNLTQKEYDKAGRLIKVTSEGKDTIYTYYGNGNRESVEYPDGSKEEYTYYKDNLLKTLTNKKADGSIIDTYHYEYDGNHNQTQKTDNKGTTTYQYDSLNRLSKVTEPNGKITSYIYDKAGNRTQESIIEGESGATTTYAYNEQNRLISTITSRAGITETIRYEYDNNGNTITKTREITKPVESQDESGFKLHKSGESKEVYITYYEYDEWNQLKKAVEEDKTIDYIYNGEGLRVEKTINGDIQRYLYEYDKVVLEVDGQNNETARNVYSTNLLARVADNEEAYYMYNGHGDVTALIDGAGNIIGAYYYDAFGNITEESGVTDNPYRYAGYSYDEETGIYYLNARYYDPKIARFLTEDTYMGSIADPLSLNLYTYCHNEPLMYWDPTGHIVTEWDKEHLTEEGIKSVQNYTDKWDELNKKVNDPNLTDKERINALKERDQQHENAEKLRDKYRTENEIGRGDGYTVNKSTNEIIGKDKSKKDKNTKNTIPQVNNSANYPTTGNRILDSFGGWVASVDDSLFNGMGFKVSQKIDQLKGKDPFTKNEWLGNPDFNQIYKAGSITNTIYGMISLGNGLKSIITDIGQIIVDSSGTIVNIVAGNGAATIQTAEGARIILNSMDNIKNSGSYTQNKGAGNGFDNFNALKKNLGPAGEGKAWHHVVEQSQIQKSGFSPQQIHNTNNVIAVDSATHAKISGYYNSIRPDISGNMRVRDWLAGQSFETQYQFGMDVLKQFGVIK